MHLGAPVPRAVAGHALCFKCAIYFSAAATLP
jgi:hypothetical protein